jgi:AraC-like DNA-binding protein
MGQASARELGFTVSADLISGLIDCAVQCGVPRTRLADMIKQHESAKPVSAPPARYSGDHILKLWDRIVRETGDPIIGFRMAFVAGVKTFGVLGQILPRCATVLEAYRQTARYFALVSQGARISVARNADKLIVSLAMPNLPPGEVSRTIMLSGLTNLCLMPQRLAGTPVQLAAIDCTFSAPGPAAVRALRRHFSFKFDAADNQVIFDRHVGDITIPSADADLQSLLAEVMDRHLATLGPAASFEQGMLTVLRGMMNGNMPTLASLSQRAGMSQRTLQRRLAESNTSFQRLLRQVLHETSDELLARESLSHGEIAFLLGYSEESAFSRAYKSWTGRPPRDTQSHAVRHPAADGKAGR